LWSDPGAQFADTAFNLTTGPYTVTVTDNNGCSNTASATITQNGNPPVIATDSANNVTCNGGSDGSIFISVSGGTGPYTYSWLPGAQTIEDITGLSVGTYTVSVIDNAGCAATSIISITEPTALNISVSGTDITCNGAGDGLASVTASNGTAPYTYLWSTTATTTSVTGLAAGFATVTVTDNCGATKIDSVNIIDPAGVTILTEVAVDIACNGANDGSITITASGGTSPLTYSIDGGVTFPSTSGIFSGLAAGSYNIVVEDASSCQMPGSTLTITEPLPLSIDSVTKIDVIGCAGSQNGMITITASGGSGPITFSIDNGNTFQASGVFSLLGPGTYVVEIKDSTNCPLTGSTFTITESPPVLVDSEAFTGITCAGDNDGTITVVGSGGTGTFNYSIDGGLTFINATGVFTSLGPGSYDIVIQDSDTCTASGSTIVITDPLGITITSETKTDVLCFGDADGSIDIVASGGTAPLSYSIDTVVFANTTGNFMNLGSGTYFVAVQDANGCSQTGSVLTISEPATAISLSDSVVSVTGCSGNSNGAIYLTGIGGTGAIVYSVDGGTTFDNGSGVFTNLAAGSYDLAAQDDNGCTVLGATVFISQPPALTIFVQSQSDPSKGNCDGSISILPLGGTPNYTYLWDDEAVQTNSTATNLCGGAFLIQVTDANGCTDTLTVTLISPDNDIFIPSAFSPNGDNENDLFRVRGSFASMTMLIYDRWGEKILETSNSRGWDGEHNGKPAISDSYGYYIELVLSDGSTQIFKGDILLVR